jgi:hypothetical protein
MAVNLVDLVIHAHSPSQLRLAQVFMQQSLAIAQRSASDDGTGLAESLYVQNSLNPWISELDALTGPLSSSSGRRLTRLTPTPLRQPV